MWVLIIEKRKKTEKKKENEKKGGKFSIFLFKLEKKKHGKKK